MLKLVLDTSFISSLFKINRLELVKRFFGVKFIYIQNAVLRELSKSKFFAEFVSLIASSEDKVDENRWVVTLNALGIKDEKLGPGEMEAIALAKDLNAVLLIDDRLARKAAEKKGVETFSLDMFLKACKTNGLIDIEDMKKIIKDLKEKHNYKFREDIKMEFY